MAKVKAAIIGSGNIGTDLIMMKTSADYGIDTRTILIELGRRRMVGGQEDVIVDLALDLASEH